MNRGYIQSAIAQQRQRREQTLRLCIANRHAKGTQGETARAWVPILIAALRGQGFADYDHAKGQAPTVRTFTDNFNDRVNGQQAWR